MSRIPRSQEHLKTAFTAEAVSAARFRAFAARAEQERMPNLARRWLRLAAVKDRLAVELLEAAEQVRGGDADAGAAIGEERYENDVLYPKMIRDVEEAPVRALFEKVVAVQREHLTQIEALRRQLNAAPGDVLPPAPDPADPAEAHAATPAARAGAAGH